MRNSRWREVKVRYHEREDGAAVRHVGAESRNEHALDWIAVSDRHRSARR